tara:strand:+ start:618 stop:1466 length:849 start_codon:yes stop_codon:yes gene_type:complete
MANEEDITFSDLIKYLLDRKKIIVAITLLSTIIAIIFSLLIKPVYTATTVLVPVQENESSGNLLNQLGGVAGLAGLSLPSGTGGDLEVKLAEITSREFAEKYINEFNLLEDLYPELWDSANNRWIDEVEEPTAFYIQKKFRESYSAVKDPKTGLVFLSVNWSDPEKAAEIANGLVQYYEDYTKTQNIKLANRKLGYLQKEITSSDLVEVKSALFNLIERESKSKMLANTADRHAFKVIDPAFVPEIRSWPARKFITILGAFLGFISSVIALLISFLYKETNK